MDSGDPSKKITSFMCSKETSAQHIGFAIGAFEEVDLAIFRGSDEDDHLGQNAIPVQAYCVPGRAEEVRNTCFPIPQVNDITRDVGRSLWPSGYRPCYAPFWILPLFKLSLMLCG